MIIINLISLLFGIGIAYTLVGGFDPAIDALVEGVLTDVFPGLEEREPLTAAFLRLFAILIFFMPIFVIIRLSIKKIFKKG